MDGMMPFLNLPLYNIRVLERNGRAMVYDPIRSKYVALTPEEWVRQHFVNFLVTVRHYPPALLGNEINLRINSTAKRCDSVVYDSFLAPLMIIEYKAPTVAIKRGVFDQISRYNTALRVRYLTVSNGLSHYCCRIDYESQTYTFLEDIPDYSDLIEASR
jgi:hypothetical protein